MNTINYCATGAPSIACALQEGESILHGLERHGVAVPSSCRSGVCQSCLMQATAGEIPAGAQVGLKDALKARGYFLACTCHPTGDMTIHPADHATQRSAAVLRRIEKLSHDVVRITLSFEPPFDYFPGQFVHLVRDDGLMRSYSLANVRPHAVDEHPHHLELHVRKMAGGEMSNWLHDEAQPGERMHIHGPQGDCFYVAGRPQQPMLLVGTGTGLAPLLAITRDALRQGHDGPIRLYHGAREPQGLYLVDELTSLAAKHPNLIYTRCLLAGVAEPSVRIGSIDQVVLADLPNLAGWRVFLCGHPDQVTAMRKKAFLAGAKMKDIYCDKFVMRAFA